MVPSMAKRTMKTGLNAKLRNMSPEERDIWGKEIFKALKAKSNDSPIVKGKMWSKRNGGRNTSVESIMDSGCTHPITTTGVTKALDIEIEPLEEPLLIVEASGKLLTILGSVKLFLEADVLGGRKLVECAVIEGDGAKEVLVSLGLMKKWDILTPSP